MHSCVLVVAQTHPFLERSIHSWTSQREAPLQERANRERISDVKPGTGKWPRREPLPFGNQIICYFYTVTVGMAGGLLLI